MHGIWIGLAACSILSGVLALACFTESEEISSFVKNFKFESDQPKVNVIKPEATQQLRNFFESKIEKSDWDQNKDQYKKGFSLFTVMDWNDSYWDEIFSRKNILKDMPSSVKIKQDLKSWCYAKIKDYSNKAVPKGLESPLKNVCSKEGVLKNLLITSSQSPKISKNLNLSK